MKWKEFVYQNVVDYCNKTGTRTFSMQEFFDDRRTAFMQFGQNNKYIRQKIRQQLQFLRDAKLISFLDNSGHYTLRGVEFLQQEQEELKLIDITRESPEKREYLVETYVRNVTWARMAKQHFGNMCICNNCHNSFTREDGSRYIEVHHITPLCKGGEDGLWNLSVLCAHHHRMAHYADAKTRITLEKLLLTEVKIRLDCTGINV